MSRTNAGTSGKSEDQLRTVITVCCFILCLLISAVSAKDFTPQEQRDIILNYMFATGQISRAQAASEGLSVEQETTEPLKCGTPAILEFVLNKDKLDKSLMKSLGVQTPSRPTGLDDSLVSPSGRFLIHYTTTGPNAVYTGFPGYADSVARIYDDVYNHMVNVLGYPAPPEDGFYPGSGDNKFDVYLKDLGSSYYGLTYVDSARIDGPGTTRATAFQVLDNDYQSITPYRNRPLDAVRVTCAHEFFHVIQFGMDFTETEQNVVAGVEGPAWQEMSAVWSEEENYTNINDYYYYLPYFFRAPWESIQSFPTSSSLHPYACGIFPIFLAQRYGKNVIRDAWIKCGQVPGPNYLTAINSVIDSVTGGTDSLATAFREFALWNYFTGSRASVAPAGVGYTERAYYPSFNDRPDSAVMAVWNSYPVTILGDNPQQGYEANPFSPDHNAAFYVRFQELPNIKYNTTYWKCNNGAFPNCTDSTKVTDTTLGYDFSHIDSLFTILSYRDTSFHHGWGVSLVYQLSNFPDSMLVDRGIFPFSPVQIGVSIINPHQYQSVTMIFSPASTEMTAFRPLISKGNFFVAYNVADSSALDSSLVNIPTAIFDPYPNPVVVSKLSDPKVTFKFQIPTDSNSFPVYGQPYSGSDPYLVIDIYTIAGEHIRTLDAVSTPDPRYGEYFSDWDLQNAAGKDVASGVYLAYARLYSAQLKGTLLAEKKTKVALIR